MNEYQAIKSARNHPRI